LLGKKFSSTILKELAATDQIVNSAWTDSKNSLDALAVSFQGNAADTQIQLDLVNATIDVISIPLQANADYATRTATYLELLESLLTLAPTDNTSDDYNSAYFLELGIIGVLISICRIIVTSDFNTRAEVIST